MEKQNKMFLTADEAKKLNLGSVQEQIEKHNKRVREEKRVSEFTRANGLETTFQK